jgi:hypothetical protein
MARCRNARTRRRWFTAVTVVTNNGQILAFNPGTGAPLWTFAGGRLRWSLLPASAAVCSMPGCATPT